MGVSKAYDSSAAFDLKSLNELAACCAGTSNRRHWVLASPYCYGKTGVAPLLTATYARWNPG
jgi:hypothetical protein